MTQSVHPFERVRSDVRALLRGTGQGGIESVVPIDGGLNGDSYLVTTAGKRYVVKISAVPSTGLLDLDAQHSLGERLAATAVTPKPVAVAADAGLFITEYYEATPMTSAETRQPDNIVRLAALLRQLHAVSADIAAFEPPRYGEAYLQALGGIAGLAPRERQLAAEMRQLAAACRAHFGAKTLCHNDLVAANVLTGAAGLRLIDFEFAVLAAPILDLASLAAMNQFGPGAEATLVGSYYKDQRQPFSRAEFAKVQRLVNLLAHFWARSRVGSAANAEVAQYIDPSAIGHD